MFEGGSLSGSSQSSAASTGGNFGGSFTVGAGASGASALPLSPDAIILIGVVVVAYLIIRS